MVHNEGRAEDSHLWMYNASKRQVPTCCRTRGLGWNSVFSGGVLHSMCEALSLILSTVEGEREREREKERERE
jgi:hypothetical protein